MPFNQRNQPRRPLYPGMGATPAPPTQPTAPTVTEEEAYVPLSVSLTASERKIDVGKDIDKDGDFILTHVWGRSTGLYTIQLRMPNGRPISSAALRSDNFVGTVQFKTPVKPARYPAGARISIDLEDLSGAPNDIEIVFGGIRQLRSR